MSEAVISNPAWISPERVLSDETLVVREPFSFMVATDMLDASLESKLNEAYPRQNGAGFLPYEPETCGEAFNKLVNQLIAPDFANAVGKQLGIENLAQYPTYISIARTLNKRHGTIHTDGKSKIATMLLYLNPAWADTSGRLRFLNKIDDIEDTIVPEIEPLYGTLVAFKRADNSFHGHLPFEGERRAIQIAWLVSEDAKSRKGKRGKLSSGVKKLFGWVDRKIAAGREDNAHRD